MRDAINFTSLSPEQQAAYSAAYGPFRNLDLPQKWGGRILNRKITGAVRRGLARTLKKGLKGKGDDPWTCV